MKKIGLIKALIEIVREHEHNQLVINPLPFFAKIQDLVSGAPATSSLQANQIRIELEHFLVSEALVHLPQKTTKSDNVKDMAEWEKRIAKVANKSEDPIGFALSLVSVPLLHMNAAHHQGQYDPIWKDDNGFVCVHQIITGLHNAFQILFPFETPIVLQEFISKTSYAKMISGRFIIQNDTANPPIHEGGQSTFRISPENSPISLNAILSIESASVKEFRHLLMNGDVVSFVNLSCDNGFLIGDKDTLLVLAPDLLIPVTMLTECLPYKSDGNTPTISNTKLQSTNIIKKMMEPRGKSRKETMVGQFVSQVFQEQIRIKQEGLTQEGNPTSLDALAPYLAPRIVELTTLGEKGEALTTKIDALLTQTEEPNKAPPCPSCGGLTQKKSGKFGAFYGCIQYPQCKGVKNIKVTPGLPAFIDQTMKLSKNYQGIGFWEFPLIDHLYGYTGKPDMVYVGGEYSTDCSLVEIKSGKDYGSSNPQHQTQIQLYGNMIKSRYESPKLDLWHLRSDNQRQPQKAITRNVVYDLAMVRNHAVQWLLDIAENADPLYSIKETVKNVSIWNFNPDIRTQLEVVLNGVDGIFLDYMGFIARFNACKVLSQSFKRFANERSTSFSEQWRRSSDSLRESGERLDCLILEKINSHTNGITIHLLFEYNLDNHENIPDIKYRDNEELILFPYDSEKDDEVFPNEFVIVKLSRQEHVIPESGKLDALGLQKHRFILEASSKIPEMAQWHNKRQFALMKSYDEHRLSGAFKGLTYLLTKMPVELRKAFLGETELKKSVTIPTDTIEIAKVAAECEYFFLIQGPPGSGKTRKLIPELVRQCQQKQPEQKILLIAMSNQAVFEICDSLYKQEIDYLQIGTSLPSHNAQWISQNSLLSIRKDTSLKNLEILHDRILNSRVIVSTERSANEALLLGLGDFTLIVDEASQLHESQLLQAMSFAKRWIFIGDHKQLPPVYDFDLDSTRLPSSLSEVGFADRPGASAMERLWRLCQNRGWTGCYATITSHFRMHQNIAQFVNKHFYSSMLVAGDERQRSTKIPLYVDCSDAIASERVIVYSVIEKDKESQRVKENDAIAKILIKLFTLWKKKQLILRNHSESQAIGIVLPFRQQSQKLSTTLMRISHDYPMFGEFRNNIRMDTVERYQGGDAEIVIFATGVCKESELESLRSIIPNEIEGEENQTSTDCKLNVAWSRTREQIILIGNQDVLNKSEHYKSLFEMHPPTVFPF